MNNLKVLQAASLPEEEQGAAVPVEGIAPAPVAAGDLHTDVFDAATGEPVAMADLPRRGGGGAGGGRGGLLKELRLGQKPWKARAKAAQAAAGADGQAEGSVPGAGPGGGPGKGKKLGKKGGLGLGHGGQGNGGAIHGGAGAGGVGPGGPAGGSQAGPGGGKGLGKGPGKGQGKSKGLGLGLGGGGRRNAAGMLLAAAAMGSAAMAEAGTVGPTGQPNVLPPAGGFTEETVVYKQTTRGDLQLHVMRPTGTAPAGGRPCMVFFHGGGWRRGSSNQFRAFGAMLAQHGIVGMSADYRLLETEERLIPVDAIEDARSAMRFVRKNAARFGCDVARIGAGGGSAGAHLAMMTAVKSPVDDAHDDLTVDPRPAALILLNGPVNFDEYPSPVSVEERRRFAPYYLLDGTFPPTLMMHGTADKVVPYRQVVEFHDKAKKLGVPNFYLVPFEGRGHGFFNKGKGQPGDWDRAAHEMLVFLHGLGWV